MISLETPQLNGPHLAWKGERPGFSLVAAGALDFRRGHQEPAGGLRKGSAPLKRELVPAAGLKDGHHLGPQVEAPSWTDSLEVFIGHIFSQGSCMPVLSPQGYFSWPLQCFKTVGLVYQYFKIKS